ncbi:MAG: MFS transporter [Methanospirillum sp.]
MARDTVLPALALAMFVIVIDTTIMNVSIADLIRDLHTNVVGVQSAITLYTLVMATMMITGGKIGDIRGRLQTFRLGLLVFAMGSLVTTLAPSLGVLILGWSVLEGLGAALVMPSLQTLIQSNFQGMERALAYGTIGGVAAIGVALGPIIGGWLTTAFTWRLAFAGEFAVVAIVLLLSRAIVDTPIEGPRPRLDYPGTILSVFGLGLVVLGVLVSTDYGWWTARQPLVLGGLSIAPFGLSVVPFMIGAGLLVLAGFVAWEARVVKRGGDPLVHVDLLGDRQLRAGLAVQVSQNTITGGLLFVMALFFQVVLGLSAMETGFLFIPLSAPLFVASLTASRLAGRIPPKRIIQAGLASTVVGLLMLAATMQLEARGLEFVAGLAVVGLGVGLVASQTMNLVISGVAPERTGETAALMSTASNLGASFGTAFLGTMLITGLLAGGLGGIEESQVIPSEIKPALESAVQKNVEFVSDAELSSELARVPAPAAEDLLAINAVARLQGLRLALVACALVALLGLLMTIRLPGGTIALGES